MKFTAIAQTLAASFLLVASVSANAEDPVEAVGAVQARLSTAMPIEALMANPAAAAVVEKHMPGITSHPAYSQFKAMSFQQVKPFSQGMVTDEMLAMIDADLAALDGQDNAADASGADEDNAE